MQKIHWLTTISIFLKILDYSEQCCGFSCVRLVVRAMDPPLMPPYCCCCMRHRRWPPYHHHGRWPNRDQHNQWPSQDQSGQWPPEDQQGQLNNQGQEGQLSNQDQQDQWNNQGQQEGDNQEGQWPPQEAQPNMMPPPSQEAPNDEGQWLPPQDSRGNNVRRTIQTNLTGKNNIELPWNKKIPSVIQLAKNDTKPKYIRECNSKNMTTALTTPLAIAVFSLNWKLAAMCIYCAPPRPPPWPRPTRPPWTRPTRPTPPYTTRTTWFTKTTQYTTRTTWFTKTTRHTTTSTPYTTTTPDTTTTTRTTTTPRTTTRTTITTTTESPTTPPWIPDVIPPNEDDEAPKFTATIATRSEEPVCSAAIISIHFLLSSCIRCLQKNGKAVARDDVVILVGEFSSDEVSGLGIANYDVKTVVLHPNCLYDGKYNLKHDVGLVQTYDEIEYSSTVAPVKVPEKQLYRPDDGRNWILAAFRPRNTIARTLKEAVWFVKVRTVQPETCLLVLNSSYYDATHNYCTPYHHYGRTDSCWDDFGASLSLDNTLIGVLIHKFRCGRVGAAGSFASIAYNSPWIRSAVQKLSKGGESV